ncbi:transmembrane 7 superfamily member 3-like isoform X2 [Dysidea avara]|uniref:transmembrane 7 superfamily member 3-like isoform X2 n=1 Tax=Dysidea avara TaxID=196820 RepID=UPI0033197E18
MVTLTVLLLLASVTIHCHNAQQQSTIFINASTTTHVSIKPGLPYPINITLHSTTTLYYSVIIVQVHTQKNVLWLASHNGGVVNGSHVGLLELLRVGVVTLQYQVMSYRHSNNESDTPVMIVTQLLRNEVPIPGGCATVSQLEYDPNLYLTYTRYTSTWNFSDADQGFSSSSYHSAPPTCDDANESRYPPVRNLEYFAYAYFLPERSYSQSEMFSGIEKMLSSDGVTSHSKKSKHLLFQDPKKVTYGTTAGQGVVYNVVVRDLTTGATSAYVPMVTYSCDFYAKIGRCDSPGSVINKVVGSLVGLLGLFLCLFGHRLFDVELVVLLIVIFSLLLFIIITRTTDWSHNGNLSYFNYNYVYGLALGCCTIIFMLPFVLFAKVLNITLCAVIGSFGVILCIGSFLQNSLTDIITDMLLHATLPGYSNSINSHPYQFTEIILTCFWPILLVGGLVTQYVITCKRPSFPKSPYKRFKEWRKNYSDRSVNHYQQEKRRLVPFDSDNVDYGSLSNASIDVINSDR